MKIRITKTALVVPFVLTLLGASSVFAGSVDVTRNTSVGVMSRHSERVKTDTGIQRSTRLVGAQGKTANRSVDLSRTATNRSKLVTVTGPDGTSKTRAREVAVENSEGAHNKTVVNTGFNGQTSTRNTNTVRTENGAASQTTFTKANGEVYQRATDVVVDKEAGTMSKNIAFTDANGEVKTRTVTRSRQTSATDTEE